MTQDTPSGEERAIVVVEICPLRIGKRVRVKQDRGGWRADWQGVYVVTGLQWEFRKGDGSRINISLASDDEITHRLGDTDGFRVDDLELVP